MKYQLGELLHENMMSAHVEITIMLSCEKITVAMAT